MLTIQQCPSCQHKIWQPALTARDYLVTGEKFTIVKCENCGLLFTNPRPEDDDLPGYYESEEYISHSNQAQSLTDRLYKVARYFTLRQKCRIIEKHHHHHDKTLLDVGCGTGHFLQHCQHKGWQISGMEPHPPAREKATRLTDTNIYANLNEIKSQQFSVITLWHVLEHVTDLRATVQRLYELLWEDGILVVAVPNHQAYEAAKFGNHWAAWDVPRHLYHFDRHSIGKLFATYKLDLIATLPMWLDSYYISLLSNQYASGHKKPLNSFITGSLSNIYAIKTGDFSSLVYLFRKAAAS